MKLIAEYDSRTFNMGFIASFWDDRIEAMFELMAMKWLEFLMGWFRLEGEEALR